MGIGSICVANGSIGRGERIDSMVIIREGNTYSSARNALVLNARDQTAVRGDLEPIEGDR